MTSRLRPLSPPMITSVLGRLLTVATDDDRRIAANDDVALAALVAANDHVECWPRLLTVATDDDRRIAANDDVALAALVAANDFTSV